MSIASLAPTAAASLAVPVATPSPSIFDADLRSALGSQTTGTGSALQSAHQTEPGRGTPAAGSRRHHHRDHGSDTAPDLRTASGQAAPGTGNGQAPTQTSGQLLQSDLIRSLQAYGAVAWRG